MDKKNFLLCALAFAITTSYAANPASKEWVLQQIAANLQQLTAADWNAVCTSGSVTSATGCYGNVTSAAFTKINNNVGRITRYANINPVNIPSSVFVKAFFGGTNTPAQAYNIHVDVSGSAARCVLFSQVGLGIGPGGINTESNTSGAFVPPISIDVVSINNDTADVAYNVSSTPVGGPVNQSLIYLLCLGYNTNDGTTAAAISVTAT